MTPDNYIVFITWFIIMSPLLKWHIKIIRGGKLNDNSA